MTAYTLFGLLFVDLTFLCFLWSQRKAFYKPKWVIQSSHSKVKDTAHNLKTPWLVELLLCKFRLYTTQTVPSLVGPCLLQQWLCKFLIFFLNCKSQQEITFYILTQNTQCVEYSTKTIFNLIMCNALLFLFHFKNMMVLSWIPWPTNGLRPTFWKTLPTEILVYLEKR